MTLIRVIWKLYLYSRTHLIIQVQKNAKHSSLIFKHQIEFGRSSREQQQKRHCQRRLIPPNLIMSEWTFTSISRQNSPPRPIQFPSRIPIHLHPNYSVRDFRGAKSNPRKIAISSLSVQKYTLAPRKLSVCSATHRIPRRNYTPPLVVPLPRGKYSKRAACRARFNERSKRRFKQVFRVLWSPFSRVWIFPRVFSRNRPCNATRLCACRVVFSFVSRLYLFCATIANL